MSSPCFSGFHKVRTDAALLGCLPKTCKSLSRQRLLEEEQVRLAFAIRRPEPGQRYRCATHPAEAPCPDMLPRFPVVAEPNFIECRVSAEIIGVPVQTFSLAHVVSQSGTDSTCAVGAADVDVPARLEVQVAQPPDPDNGIAS